MKENKILFKSFRFIQAGLLIFVIGVFGNVQQLHAQTQHYSFDFRNKTVQEAIAMIEKQSNYAFLFSEKSSSILNRKLNTQVKDTAINGVLDRVFKDLPLSYKIVGQQILLTLKTAPVIPQAPIRKIQGTVKDNRGETLPGVSIVLKAFPSLGTTTDIDGNFVLQVPEDNESLLVSFVGMETLEVKLQEGVGQYDVILQPSNTELSEVVAVGYFNRKKDSFTGSAVTVSGEQLRQVNPNNVFQSLQTFDPSFRILENNLLGSDPNSLPNINVRGTSSVPTGGNGEVLRRDNINSNVNMPTFILDGYEVGVERIYDLDVNRIASITLLKDAAATAIYGSRASNGVMVITTVAPKEGQLEVTYNLELNTSITDLSSYHVLNARDKLEYERLAGLYDYNGALNQDELDELYYQKMYNIVSGVDTYWLSQPIRSTLGHKHSLYISGGSQAMRYGIDLHYQGMPGVMKKSERNRYGIGVELSYNKDQKLLFKNTLSFDKVKAAESPYGSFSEYVRMNPYYPKTDGNGQLIQEIDSWTDRSGAGGSMNTATVLNPLFDATLNSFQDKSYWEVNDVFSIEWNITEALRLRALASIGQKSTYQDEFVSPLDNEYYFYATQDLKKRGKYTYNREQQSYYDGNATLTYSNSFGRHFVNLALGANLRENKSSGESMVATGFTNDRFTSIGFANSYKENSSPYSTSSKERLFGTFLSANYSFDNRYLLDLSVRADGSSKFGSDNKVAPFWALGIGWNLHHEKALQAVGVLSQLRLKANTGLTGAVSFTPYMANTLYEYYKDNWYSTGVGAIVDQYGNENLKWQRTRNYDIGLDLGFLDDRFFVSGRYYYKLTQDMLTDVTLPPSTGFSYYKENLGDIRNQGYELYLKLQAVKQTDITVAVFGNFTHNRNKLVKISNSLKKLNEKADESQLEDEYKGTPLLRYNEGLSMNTIYAVRSLGIDPENGKELFITKEGQLTHDWNVADIVPICDASPDLEGFFGGNIYYKGFLLNFSFYTRFGGYEYNQTLVDRVENADPRYNVDRRAFKYRWANPGDVARFKDIADLGSTQVTQRFIEKDNVLELKSVYLSYDFSPAIAKKLFMKSLRASVTLNDLWRTSSIAIERGIDYPFARIFIFSLQTTF